jgi:hypothetical protein
LLAFNVLDGFFDGGSFAGLGNLGDPCCHRVQVDVGACRQQRQTGSYRSIVGVLMGRGISPGKMAMLERLKADEAHGA